MIGELFQMAAKEIAGDDPENQRIAGAPYKAAKLGIGLSALNRTP